MPQSQTGQILDFHSHVYCDAFSHINGIVIEGEQEAHDNFLSTGQKMEGLLELIHP